MLRKGAKALRISKARLGDRFMMSFPRSFAGLMFGMWAAGVAASAGPLAATTGFVASDAQRAALQHLLDNPIAPVIVGQSADIAALRRLYQAHGYDLLWANRGDRVVALGSAFDNAADDGLDLPVPLPDPRKVKTADAVERDVLLSASALRLATALAVGRARPEQWEEDWAVAAPNFDAVAGLDKALGDNRLGPWLAGLAPSDLRYVRLKSALALYRELARHGNWPQVPGGPTIKPGMADERVGILRKRLIAEGYLPSEMAPRMLELPADIADDSAGATVVSSAEVFDATIEQGVRAFQRRHGIVEDGAVGARTLAALNVSVRARVEQIALTLERWRSLPRDFGKNYVFVNVPGESLEVFEDGRPVMAMNVVVGDPGHPTPVVQSHIAAITFNPTWRVPLSIGKAEIAGKVKADPRYLEKNQMVQKGTYYFEQLPGPKNPLGQVKFETPNKFDVYLHDTSSPTAFARAARALSHGCVRVQDARGLAAYILGGPKWNGEEIDNAINLGETQRADVVRKLRVSILYFTSFVDVDGTIEFRDDIYGRDKRLRAALDGGVPVNTANSKTKTGVI
jgi:L,D-transpeptidase YcbB